MDRSEGSDWPGGGSDGAEGSRSTRLFWQDGRWRPAVLIDWTRWDRAEDARRRADEGRAALAEDPRPRATALSALTDLLDGRTVRESPPPPPAAGVGQETVSPSPPAPPGGEAPPPVPPSPPAPPAITLPDPRRRRRLWIKRGLAGFGALLLLIIGWLAITAPLSKSLQPIAPPQLTLLASDGQPIARHGAIVDRPVDVRQLPPHVTQAFLAIEDRGFYSHIGISARGLARAAWTNVTTGATHGGSTITQQLAKFTFLNADQTYTRKAREALIALWMEAWLSKDEILSRYLSNAHFGGRVYGLRAASMHYFYRQPERLTLSQAAMLAGMLRAPNRYDPMRNLRGAQQRERVVLGAMVDAGFLSEARARAVRPATVDHRARGALPTGTYFADWAFPQARDTIESGYEERRVETTLDSRLQRIARQAVANAGLGRAQVALVAMRTNGEVVAMIGGRSYADSPFNRATQARRQPGSTFKLFVYYAALRAGMTPDTLIDDTPITSGDYRPANYGDRYRGRITLREAFAQSSNVAAVRLYHQLGPRAVAEAARDLGVTSPLADNASTALGSSSMTLLELTSAYAAVAADYAPVEPHAISQPEPGLIERLFDGRGRIGSRAREQLFDLLAATVQNGTGRNARLAIPAYGKTGTSQDNRDALFVGFAGDLVVGVWVGNDDNTPLRGITGGSVPARIWRNFMSRAIPGAAPRAAPRQRPAPEPQEPAGSIFDDLPVSIAPPKINVDPQRGVEIETNVGGVDVRVGRDGVEVSPPPPPPGAEAGP